MPSWGNKGNQTAGSGLGGGNIGGQGGKPGGKSGGTGNGGNQGGMSPSLLDAKYPGAKGKKNKQYEASLGNLAKVGTIMGGMVGGPVGSVIAGGYSAADAIANGTNPLSGALDPFSGQMADANSVGAGYADGGPKMMEPAEKKQADKSKAKSKKQPLSKGFTLLANAGGTLLGN